MSEEKSIVQKQRRGFASMSTERQKAIASQGGKAAHQQGVAHEWNSSEAKEAGRKGGQVSGTKRRSANTTPADNISEGQQEEAA